MEGNLKTPGQKWPQYNGGGLLYPHLTADTAKLQLSGFSSLIIVTIDNMAGKSLW